jgi:HD-GYP domain-containing protein (c-di-GMP phosphodiesterase class II)
MALNRSIVDADGTLILGGGVVVGESRALDKINLIEEETISSKYTPPKTFEEEKPAIVIPPFEDNETPFEVIDKIIRQIESLFRKGDIRAQKYFVKRVLNVCKLIQRVCYENKDLALGSILLEQQTRYTVRHPLRTAIVCHIVLGHLGWAPEEQSSLVAAAITMNIGMLEMQEEMHKQEAPLSARQKDAMKKHPSEGAALLKKLGVTDKLWLDAVLQHHEALDGSGYPNGFKDSEIGIGARVLSLADAYCARVAGRNYRPPLSPSVAVRNLFLSNTHPVDKDLAISFVKNLGVFPPGTFVKLKNGETAIVTQRGEKINFPIVHILVRGNGERLISPIKRDTATSEDFAVKEVITQEKARVEINRFQLWGYGMFKREKTRMRKTDRLQIELPAKLLDIENLSTADCDILNVSETGCLLKTLVGNDKALIVNKTYHLTFRILGKTLENLSSMVRNSQIRYGIQMVGMQFLDITPEQQKHITLYLKKEAEKEAEEMV